MSDIFHRTCYTRCAGYKYRTLATNTGEKKRRDSKDDNTFERKFRDLKKEITSRIDTEVNKSQVARQRMRTKLELINAKVDTMLELQSTVTSLAADLHVAESNLADMMLKVEQLDSMTTPSSGSRVMNCARVQTSKLL